MNKKDDAVWGHSGIYKILNKVNKKVYIGQAVCIGARWYSERKLQDVNSHLRRAFNYYGIDNFEFSVIEYTDNLTEREQYWIDFYDSRNRDKGYNKKDAGRQGRLNQEIKDKIAESNRGKHFYNNGIIQVKSPSCPEGFVVGMLPGRNKNRVGGKHKPRTAPLPYKGKKKVNGQWVDPAELPPKKFWYNNGEIESFGFQLPRGFVKGRLTIPFDLNKFMGYNKGDKNG